MNILQIRRKTLESDVEIKINFFGSGFYKIKTFIFFFDHLFSSFINYSLIDCYLRCYSDLKNDSHHLIEDIGISVGIIFSKKKFSRYNTYYLCMDDTLLMISIDISKRFFYYDNLFILDYDIFLIKEFLISFSKKINCNIYIYIYCFNNKHHLLEAIFKLLGLLFKKIKHFNNLNSTKGIL